MGPAVILMSRVPVPGKTKTRLMEKMSGEECAIFHHTCLKDTWDVVFQTKIPCYLYYYGGNPADFQSREFGLTQEDLELLHIFPQKGSNLGERMYHASREVLKKHSSVAIIGTDIPGLNSETILSCFKELKECDVVIGPANDGGYYLIGLKKPQIELLQDINWGTGQVLAQTLEKAKSAGISVKMLKEQADIDTWDDLLGFFQGPHLINQPRDKLQSYRFARWMVEKYGA